MGIGHAYARRFMVAVDAELGRLDDLIDSAVGLAKVRGGGLEAGSTDTASLFERRYRLGRNLKRLMGTRPGYANVATCLALFSRHLAKFDPCEGDASLASPDEIEADGQALRRAVCAVAGKNWYWRYFRSL
jgi:hypothetical protein